MTRYREQLEEIFAQNGIGAEDMDKSDLRSFQKSWLQTYVNPDFELVEDALSQLRSQGLRPIKERVGKGDIVGIHGAPAEDAYLHLPPAAFICWEPFGSLGLYCANGNGMPLFNAMPCGERITITSPDLDWTAMLPGACCAGDAFFARAEWQPSTRRNQASNK